MYHSVLLILSTHPCSIRTSHLCFFVKYIGLSYRSERTHTRLRTLAMYTPPSHSRPDHDPFRISMYRFACLIQSSWFGGQAGGMIYNPSQAGATPDTRHTRVNSELTTGVCPTALLSPRPCLRLRTMDHYPCCSSTSHSSRNVQERTLHVRYCTDVDVCV